MTGIKSFLWKWHNTVIPQTVHSILSGMFLYANWFSIISFAEWNVCIIGDTHDTTKSIDRSLLPMWFHYNT